MARIRTIKPEFSQSESMGRVSRDARLTFVLLWTIADDQGRMRGNTRLLARSLFPYDDDATERITEWLFELEREQCITRYGVDADSYVQINHWTDHQKIDRPTPSRFPSPDGVRVVRIVERDIEAALAESIRALPEFCGAPIVDVARQARADSRYIDILVTTPNDTYAIEVKRGRLTAADMRQVLGYAKLTGAAPILVGAGVSAQFSLPEATDHGVAVWTITDDTVSTALASKRVRACEITLANARERCMTPVGLSIPVNVGSGSGPKDLDLDREWEPSRATAHTPEPESRRDPVTGYVAGAARMRPAARQGLVSGAPPSAVFACAAFSVPAFLHADLRGKLTAAGVADPDADLMAWYGRLREQQQGQETPGDTVKWLRAQYDAWRQPAPVRKPSADDDGAARLAAWAAGVAS